MFLKRLFIVIMRAARHRHVAVSCVCSLYARVEAPRAHTAKKMRRYTQNKTGRRK